MSQRTVEERLEVLESQVQEIRTELQKLAQPLDWRSTIGMFAGDEAMKRIFEAGRKIREKDRERAQQASKQKHRGTG